MLTRFNTLSTSVCSEKMRWLLMPSLHAAGKVAPGYNPYTWDAMWEVHFVSQVSQPGEVAVVPALLKEMPAELFVQYVGEVPL
jgi:hypothetical protein